MAPSECSRPCSAACTSDLWHIRKDTTQGRVLSGYRGFLGLLILLCCLTAGECRVVDAVEQLLASCWAAKSPSRACTVLGFRCSLVIDDQWVHEYAKETIMVGVFCVPVVSE